MALVRSALVSAVVVLAVIWVYNSFGPTGGVAALGSKKAA